MGSGLRLQSVDRKDKWCNWLSLFCSGTRDTVQKANGRRSKVSSKPTLKIGQYPSGVDYKVQENSVLYVSASSRYSFLYQAIPLFEKKRTSLLSDECPKECMSISCKMKDNIVGEDRYINTAMSDSWSGSFLLSSPYSPWVLLSYRAVCLFQGGSGALSGNCWHTLQDFCPDVLWCELLECSWKHF